MNYAQIPERVRYITDELKHIPTEREMDAVPYWKGLMDAAKIEYGSLDTLRMPEQQELFVDFPSQDQEETATQILEKRRILVRDSAGSGKTAPAVKAKYALEQLVYNGKVINIVICPGYVTSSWRDKIAEYTDGNARVEVITSKSRQEKMEELKKGLQRNEVPDFLVVSYDSVFRDVKYRSDSLADIDHLTEEEVKDGFENDLADELLHYAESSGLPLYLVLDEPQHIKTPERERSKAVRKLALEADHLSALSGTIFPDSLDDIYELMSLFDPERYPTAKDAEQLYQDDPRLIRLFLHRFGKQPVIDIKSELSVNSDVVDFELSEGERRIYNRILDTSLGSEKYMLLWIAATDPTLLNPRTYLGSESVRKKLWDIFGDEDIFNGVEPQRYKETDKLVEQAMDKGEKVVIFAKFREGVMDELQRRYSKYGVCRIDGSVSAEPNGELFSDRDIQRLEFQTNPDKRIMLATINSIREGQDLHAANNVIFFNRDVSPGYNDQPLGRVARMSQTRPVNVRSLCANATVEVGIYATESAKRSAIEMVDKGLELTPEQRQLLSGAETNTSFISQYLQNPEVLLRRMIGQMTNKGAALNAQYLAFGENARLFAEAYNYRLPTSYAGQTGRLIKWLIAELLGEMGEQFDIIDLASPGVISRITGRKSTAIDINKYQIEIGLREAAKLGVDLRGIVGNVEDLRSLGIEDQSYDLAVLSLALHYGEWRSGGRKRMILEANRAVKDGRYVILTIPESRVTSRGVTDLETGLEHLGLEPVEGRHSLARALDSSDREFRVYAGLYRKIFTPPVELYTSDQYNELFRLKNVATESYPRKSSPGMAPQTHASNDICNVFQFSTGDIIGERQRAARKRGTKQMPQTLSANAILEDPDTVLEILDRLRNLAKEKNKR